MTQLKIIIITKIMTITATTTTTTIIIIMISTTIFQNITEKLENTTYFVFFILEVLLSPKMYYVTLR